MIRIKDALSEIIHTTSADHRIANLLWAMLRYNYQINIPTNLVHAHMRNCIASELNKSAPMQTAAVNAVRCLTSKENLKWITDSRAQRNWIERKFNGIQIPIIELINCLRNDEALCLMIDFYDFCHPMGQTIAHAVQSDWEQQEKEDRPLDWFKQEDEETKCRFAYEFLCKKGQFNPLLDGKISSLEDLLIYTYTMRPSRELIELLLQATKARWSKEKHKRKNKNKEQCNILLTNEGRARLKSLAKKHEISQARVVEILLKMEDEEGAYIPKRLKVLMDA